MKKGKGLGRGLSSLLPEADPLAKADASEENPSSPAQPSREASELKLFEIEPNRKQPRRYFDEQSIQTLAESIKENGVIQPIIVRKNDIGYTIVAGERRWRAAKAAGLKTIPAVIRDYSDEQSAAAALIENLQREDLNPIEEAAGYKALMEDFGMTQDGVAKRLGKSRSAVANTMRLLTLDEEIREFLVNGELTSGHARALLSVEDPQLRHELAQKIIADGLNVRQSEQLAKRFKNRPKKPSADKESGNKAYQIQLERLQAGLSERFGTKVKIISGARKGRIELEFYGGDDLERLLELLGEDMSL